MRKVQETRPVTTAVQGQDWIITDGLKAGDKVIVDGVAKVKKVKKFLLSLTNLKHHKVKMLPLKQMNKNKLILQKLNKKLLHKFKG
jgi:hypothetical protein